MKTDIVLSKDDKTLIIDTKYYSKVMTQNYEKDTLRSGHLYQIFSYVKNMEAKTNGRVSGLLLYSKTDEEIFPEDGEVKSFITASSSMGVKTLDLNQDFKDISKQLDEIIKHHFAYFFCS